jgi:hypothetical protein
LHVFFVIIKIGKGEVDMCMTRKARIAYDGPIISEGEMDVRDLAPALIAFADLVEHASSVIGNEHKIKVMLNQDSIKKGSFDITLLLDINILEQAQLFMGMAKNNGIDDLMTILGWFGGPTIICGGIFSLIKKIRGRKLKDIRHVDDKNAEIVLNDGDVIPVPNGILKVFLDVDCRVSIEKIVEPLKRPGIDKFELRDVADQGNKEPLETIDKKMVYAFAAPDSAGPDDEDMKPSPEQEMLAKIVSLNFANGKWKLTDGTNNFWASIQDEEFNNKIERGEISFTNGDMLHVRFYLQQTVKQGSLSTEHIVTKVLELRKAPKQIKLDFDYKK